MSENPERELVYLSTILRLLTVIAAIHFGGAKVGIIFAAGVATPSVIALVNELRATQDHD